jgi:hypothetical protein
VQLKDLTTNQLQRQLRNEKITLVRFEIASLVYTTSGSGIEAGSAFDMEGGGLGVGSGFGVGPSGGGAGLGGGGGDGVGDGEGDGDGDGDGPGAGAPSMVTYMTQSARPQAFFP